MNSLYCVRMHVSNKNRAINGSENIYEKVRLEIYSKCVKMVIEYTYILKGIIKMKNNEIRKSFKITKELNDMLQEAVRVTGTTETSLIKVALFEYLKGIKL